MSPLGQNRTWRVVRAMPALPPKADKETFDYAEGRVANDAISTSGHDHAKQRWQ
jgi:hypothetical protein